MNDPHDPIFDAFLAEALEEVHPPDVVESVLAELRQPAKTMAARSRGGAASSQAARGHAAGNSQSWWWSLAGVVLLGVSLGLVLLGLDAWQRQRWARRSNPSTPTLRAEPADLARSSSGATAANPSASIESRSGNENGPAAGMADNSAPDSRPAVAANPNFLENPTAVTKQDAPGQPGPDLLASSIESADLKRMVTEIDAALATVWRDYGIEPAATISRQAWAERVVDTLQPQIATDAAERTAMVGLLSAGTPAAALESYFQNYGAAATEALSRRIAERLLLGRQVSQPVAAQRLQAYLQHAWQARLPWSRIVQRLIDPALVPGGNGALVEDEASSWLRALVASYGPQSPELVDHVGRVFLQAPLGCARCHDGPPTTGLAETREQYWQFAAYFQQLGWVGTPAQLSKQDYLPTGRASDQDVPVFYEQPDGRVAVAYPAFGGNVEAATSGLWREFDRLATVAQHIAGSSACAEAGVDWAWEALAGYPLVGNPSAWPGPVNPQFEPLREVLAEQLGEHQDLPAVCKAILLSDVFWREATPTGSVDLPYFGTPAYFSHAYPRLPRQASVDTGLASIAAEYQRGGGASGVYARIVDLTAQASGAAVANGGSESAPAQRPAPTDRTPNRPANSERSAQADPRAPGASDIERAWGVPEPMGILLQNVATGSLAEEAKIRHFFWIGLGRDPSPQELERARQILVLAKEPNAGFQDLWGAIWLSNEIGAR